MAKEYQISWLKVIGITLLLVIVIALLFIVVPKNKSNANTTSSTFINNINMMKQAGFEYFQGSNLPNSVGETNRITLDEMINTNLIIDFTTIEDKTCNKSDSYIQATKTLDNEYALKVSLNCEDKSDYIVTTIANDIVCTDCNITNNGSKPSTSDESNNTPVVNNYNYYGDTAYKDNAKEKEDTITKTTYTTINTNYNIKYINSCRYCITDDCKNDCMSEVYYTVNFDPDGGSFVPRQIVKQGNYAKYSTTYREGYEFLGWYLNGYKYDFNTPVYKRITLVAKWKKIENDNKKNIYVVDFDSNGGSYVPSQRVEEYDTVKRPNNPTKKCYDFGGWYLDKNLTNRYNFSSSVTKNFTLYAKWIPNDTCKNMYRVTFNSNGGSYVSHQDVMEGDTAYRPSNPTRSGYTFIGWYTSNSFSSLYNFNSAVRRNITLYARWEKDEVKYNKYCKIEKQRYNSWSYTSYRNNMSPYTYNWTIKFDKLTNARNVKISNVNYVSDYNRFYYEYSTDRGISMVGENGSYSGGKNINSGSMMKQYSLKHNNFNKSLSKAYFNGFNWYTNASVTVFNYSGVSKYYLSSINNYVYFVPFTFDVEYTNLNNCVTDKASNSSNYRNYEVVSSYYR